MHKLFDIESPLLGILATIVAVVLTILPLVTWGIAIRDANRVE